MVRYILRNGQPSPCTSEAEWIAFLEDVPARTLAKHHVNDILVATLFNGVAMVEPGSLWETSVFSPSWEWQEQFCRSYSSPGEALKGHAEVLAILKEAPKVKEAVRVDKTIRKRLMTWAVGEA